MAKWRAIYATITTDEKVNRLSEFGIGVYDRMVVKADDWGVITGDPFGFKLATVPASSRNLQEVEDLLQEMAELGLIWLYQSDGFGPLVQIRWFDEHQPGDLIRKRSAPKHPLHPDWRPMPDDNRSSGLLREMAGNSEKILPKSRVDKSRVEENRIEETRQEKSITQISDSFSHQWHSILSELKNMHDRKAVDQHFTARTGIKDVTQSAVIIQVPRGDVFLTERVFKAKLAQAIGIVCPEWGERELIIEAEEA